MSEHTHGPIETEVRRLLSERDGYVHGTVSPTDRVLILLAAELDRRPGARRSLNPREHRSPVRMD